MGFPGGSQVKSVCLQCGRPGFDPWIGKIPWRRKWQPTPVFLPGESHGQRSLVDYSPQGHKESDMTERLHFQLKYYLCVSIISVKKPSTWKQNKMKIKMRQRQDRKNTHSKYFWYISGDIFNFFTVIKRLGSYVHFRKFMKWFQLNSSQERHQSL